MTLIAKATAAIEAYQRVHGKEQISKRNEDVSKQDQWSPPPIGYYKVNVDAIVHTKQQLTGLGVVIRNSQGQVIVAQSKAQNSRIMSQQQKLRRSNGKWKWQ